MIERRLCKMELDNIFQYVFDYGFIGGIVIADNMEDALKKVGHYINTKYSYMSKEEQKAIIWKLSDSTNIMNDVYEVFNV